MILIVLSILIIIYILRKNEIINETFFDTLFDIPTIRRKQEETNQHIFGNRLETCKSIPISTSQGLIMDSSIVCNVTKDVKNPPTFYYEVYPENPDKNAFFFVNLDLTDFRKLQEEDPNSPQTILCKTRQTYDILSRLLRYKKVIYTGFTSVDKWIQNISKNYRSYIHVAGKSEYKGTHHVIEAWTRHPEWPTLTLICRDEILETSKHLLRDTIKNINLVRSFLSDKELDQLMNKNGIHICTSKHEGFGHYLNEARSSEAVVLYTNAPPMNEKFVDGVSGISVISTNGIPVNNGICPTYNVSANTIEQSVERTLRMSITELAQIGKKARQDFLRDDHDFKQRLLSIL